MATWVGLVETYGERKGKKAKIGRNRRTEQSSETEGDRGSSICFKTCSFVFNHVL